MVGDEYAFGRNCEMMQAVRYCLYQSDGLRSRMSSFYSPGLHLPHVPQIPRLMAKVQTYRRRCHDPTGQGLGRLLMKGRYA
eukprot:COSAG02_NODE_7286_length_3084_cov_6.649702_2_plen_81_part_00